MGAGLKRFGKSFGKNIWDRDRSGVANIAGLMGPLGMLVESHINRKEDRTNEIGAASDAGFDASKGFIDEGSQDQLDRLNPLIQDIEGRQSDLSKWYDETRGKSYQDTAEAQQVLTQAKQGNQDDINSLESSSIQQSMTPEQKLAYKAQIKQNYDSLLGGLAAKDTAYKKGNRDEFNSLSNLYSSNKANLVGAQNAITGTATNQTLGAEAFRQGGNMDWMNRRLQGFENLENNVFQLGGKVLDFAGSAATGGLSDLLG